jgi:hypothetical protein
VVLIVFLDSIAIPSSSSVSRYPKPVAGTIPMDDENRVISFAGPRPTRQVADSGA